MTRDKMSLDEIEREATAALGGDPGAVPTALALELIVALVRDVRSERVSREQKERDRRDADHPLVGG